eukprot:1853679-Alexandrium_andersonii.AAC.1
MSSHDVAPVILRMRILQKHRMELIRKTLACKQGLEEGDVELLGLQLTLVSRRCRALRKKYYRQRQG